MPIEPESFQDIAIEFITELRMGGLPDNESLEEFILSLDRASQAWKSVGYMDTITAGILIDYHPVLRGCSALFPKSGGGQDGRNERERFNYIERRVTDQIARSLTDDCPTLHDMVRKVLNNTQQPPTTSPRKAV